MNAEATSSSSTSEAVVGDQIPEWEERLRAAIAETLRLRARKAALRAEFATRRAYGLRARHATKLRRQQAAGDTTKENHMPTDQLAHVKRLAMAYGHSIREVKKVEGPEPLYQAWDCSMNPPVLVGGDEFGLTLASFEEAYGKALASGAASAERAAWEAMHLGLNGDYIDLGNGRCVKKADYDPEKHGQVEIRCTEQRINELVMERELAWRVEHLGYVHTASGYYVKADFYDPQKDGPLVEE